MGNHRTKLLTAVAVAGASLALAACGSNGHDDKGNGAGPSVSSSAPALSTGTETFSGNQTVTAQNLANPKFSPTVPVNATGLFLDTGTMSLADTRDHDSVISLTRGRIYVTHSPGVNTRQLNTRTCWDTMTTKGTYVVTGGSQVYAHATGHGSYTIQYVVLRPRQASGQCNSSLNARPVQSGKVSFNANGPVSVPKGQLATNG